MIIHKSKLYRDPYPHLIINNFIPTKFLAPIIEEYDKLLKHSDNWKTYDNPIEKKKSFNCIQETVYLQELIKYVGDQSMLNELKEKFGLEDDIELDTNLYGAGYHNHSYGGYLSTHLDYEINPNTKKKRWLNLIIYINTDWKTEYNGDTELWNKDCSVCEKRIYPEFNKALIFKTDGESWHGVSREIKCQQQNSRKTIAFYFVSKRLYEIHSDSRLKATFFNPKYPQLCIIRSTRLLTQDDVDTSDSSM